MPFEKHMAKFADPKKIRIMYSCCFAEMVFGFQLSYYLVVFV